MSSRYRRVAGVALAALAACGLLIWGVWWYRARQITPVSMFQRLPSGDALVLYVDFQTLRTGGLFNLLEGAKTTGESDYLDFVRQTGFDYRKDLDAAMVAFSPTGRYLLLKGRFNWESLAAYTRSQGGSCEDSFCRMQGSTPERKISFFPISAGYMAMAVSPDVSAALRLKTPAEGQADLPAAPVWMAVPHSMLASGDDLPTGTRIFARSLDRADVVLLALAPEAQRAALRLDVRCRTEQDATGIASELTKYTTMLREMIARENQTPSPADLSGLLTSGTFHAEGKRVAGYWPIERVFLETLLGGSLAGPAK